MLLRYAICLASGSVKTKITRQYVEAGPRPEGFIDNIDEAELFFSLKEANRVYKNWCFSGYEKLLDDSRPKLRVVQVRVIRELHNSY